MIKQYYVYACMQSRKCLITWRCKIKFIRKFRIKVDKNEEIDVLKKLIDQCLVCMSKETKRPNLTRFLTFALKSENDLFCKVPTSMYMFCLAPQRYTASLLGTSADMLTSFPIVREITRLVTIFPCIPRWTAFGLQQLTYFGYHKLLALHMINAKPLHVLRNITTNNT